MTSPIAGPGLAPGPTAGAVAPSPPQSPAAADRGTRSFAQVLATGPAQPAHAPPRSPAPGSPQPAGTTGPDSLAPARRALEQLVNGVRRSEDRVESLLAAARSGRTFSPAELLALQSETFRYAQTVEVVSRTADRLVSGLKQLLNTQV